MTIGTLQVEAIGVEEQQKYGERRVSAGPRMPGAGDARRRDRVDRGEPASALRSSRSPWGDPVPRVSAHGRGRLRSFHRGVRPAEFSVRRVAVERRAGDQDAAGLHGQRSSADGDDFSAPRDGADAALSRQAVLLLRAAGGHWRRDAAVPVGRPLGSPASGMPGVRRATANRRD